MTEKTKELTNMHSKIIEFQNKIRAIYSEQNKTVQKGQIVFVGSSHMEIFPIQKMQETLKLDKVIYNRGVRATTTADLLNHMDTLIFDLEPDKIFINIGSNDIGFYVPEEIFIANYSEILRQIKERLPETAVYVMAYYPVNATENFGETKEEHNSLFHTRSNGNLNAANDKVKALAEKYGYQFINLNNGLSDECGNLKKELTFDGVHLLPSGYEIVLRNMVKYLK